METSGGSAVVTGAASGLGAATAEALAARGVTVFGFDLPSAVETADPPAGVTLVPVDVTRAEEVARAVEEADAAAPLRVAVNCAGIAPSARVVGRSGVHDPTLFSTVVMVNLVGSFHVLSAAAAAMSRHEPDLSGHRGVVVNTASIAAYDGQVGQIAYAASKGGVVAMTLPAARDLAQHGIRVCTIAPGTMDTAMLSSFPPEVRESLAGEVPFPRRLGTAREFADLALMVVDHDYLNGEIIRMDGALRMAPR